MVGMGCSLTPGPRQAKLPSKAQPRSSQSLFTQGYSALLCSARGLPILYPPCAYTPRPPSLDNIAVRASHDRNRNRNLTSVGRTPKMPSHTLRTALYLSPSLLVLASSALLIILERVTTSLFRSHTSRDFRTGTPGLSDTDLVVNQDYAPTWALLGAAVLGVLLSCFSAAGMWELRRVDATRGAGQRVWCWGVVGMNAVLLGVSVGVLGWTSGLQAAQSGADLTVAGGGEYTRETWVCRIDALYKDEGWAGSACGTAVCTPSTYPRGDMPITAARLTEPESGALHAYPRRHRRASGSRCGGIRGSTERWCRLVVWWERPV